MQDYTDYRPNVAAIILSSDYPNRCEYMIARRNGMKRGWQFPQGGIHTGESITEALMRELLEEIGTNEVEILAEYPEWISYDFPKKAVKQLYPFKGQRQKYFLVRLKREARIDLFADAVPEFEEYGFVTYDELFRKATYFKRKVYRQVIHYFIREGLL